MKRKHSIPLAGAVACLVAAMGVNNAHAAVRQKEWCQYPLAALTDHHTCTSMDNGGSYTSQ